MSGPALAAACLRGIPGPAGGRRRPV